MPKLKKFIDKAFERWEKEKQHHVHESYNPEMWNLNMVVLLHRLDCFEQLAENTNLIFSFYVDKVKVKFKLNTNEYIIDFFFNDEDGVLVGKMDADNVYSLMELSYDKLEAFVKNLSKD